MSNGQPKVGILMGSDSDLEVMREAAKRLESFGIGYEIRIMSAHRTPDKAAAVAGLKMGDVITGVDNHAIYNLGDFWHAYLSTRDHNPAQLTLQGRTGQETIPLPRMNGGARPSP